jgi:hypothetical protein
LAELRNALLVRASISSMQKTISHRAEYLAANYVFSANPRNPYDASQKYEGFTLQTARPDVAESTKNHWRNLASVQHDLWEKMIRNIAIWPRHAQIRLRKQQRHFMSSFQVTTKCHQLDRNYAPACEIVPRKWTLIQLPQRHEPTVWWRPRGKDSKNRIGPAQGGLSQSHGTFRSVIDNANSPCDNPLSWERNLLRAKGSAKSACRWQ